MRFGRESTKPQTPKPALSDSRMGAKESPISDQRKRRVMEL
jgi:hypothetical protein